MAAQAGLHGGRLLLVSEKIKKNMKNSWKKFTWRAEGWAGVRWWREIRTEVLTGPGCQISGSVGRPWRGRGSGQGAARRDWSSRWISPSLWAASATAQTKIYLFPRRRLSLTCRALPPIFPGVFPNQECPSSSCLYLASEGHTLTTVSWHSPEMENVYKEKKIFW